MRWRRRREGGLPPGGRDGRLGLVALLAGSALLVTGAAAAAATSTRTAGPAVVAGTSAPGDPPVPARPAAATSTGYDLVGSDGGVFAFGGRFFGSLPGLGIHVNDIVGIVPSSDYQGYFLVASDGGVFSFGDTQFEGSLPGLGVHVHDIVGIVPTADDRGYFLVGADGGVFAFGDAPYEGSLPALGVHISDAVSIAPNATDTGYWVLARNGAIYALGTNTPYPGNAYGSLPFVSIVSTADGSGLWVTDEGGEVYKTLSAPWFGDLAGSSVRDIVSLVPTAVAGTSGNQGYWLIGSDGGVFGFGDAYFLGSLPSIGIHVANIVGAVPS